jgi:hypothetical protein
LILTYYTYSRTWDNEIALREAQRMAKEKEAALQEKEVVLEENAQQMARDRETIAALQAQLTQSGS